MSSGLQATSVVSASDLEADVDVKRSDSKHEPATALPVVDNASTVNGIDNSAKFMQLEEHPVENFRRMRVIVMGAGFSGIYMGIRIPERLRNIDLTIYEKNDGFAGTWWENRYPGIACDIPAHSYCYTFEPNLEWSSFYGSGPEIQKYMEGIALKYSVDRYVKFGHKIIECTWNSERKKWSLKVQNTHTNEVIEDEADVVINAGGALNQFKWPDIPGLKSFEGKLMHSANWDTSVDCRSKRIGVIGVGSSAIQIIPQLQKLEGTQLSCFIRGKTWIAAPFGESAMQKLGMSTDRFTKEDIQKFKDDPKAYHTFRKTIEHEVNSVHSATLRGSGMSEGARHVFTQLMRERLAKKPEILEKILPDFAPGCRRLTPGPGFLEALTEDNVDFISKQIQKVVPEGVVLEDGTLVDVDVLVCATGFSAASAPPFPIIGLNGISLHERFDPYPEAYMSTAVDGFPNWFTILGPNAGVGSGSLTKIIESICDYALKCIRKMQKEGISAMHVKKERVRDFNDYAKSYFQKTVYMGDCTAWYRRGDRIIALWPGSTLHAVETLRSPRWEDFNYEYDDDDSDSSTKGNRMAWLGNGWSSLQTEDKDMAYYIEREFVDVPSAPLPEKTPKWHTLPFSH